MLSYSASKYAPWSYPVTDRRSPFCQSTVNSVYIKPLNKDLHKRKGEFDMELMILYLTILLFILVIIKS